MPIHYDVYDTKHGDVTLISNERRLLGLLFGDHDPYGAINEENTVLYDGIVELNQYFFGQRKSFSVKLEPVGSEFDQKVWDYVRTIPYGQTRSYEEVAKAIGEPNGARAVLNSLNHNPLPVFIPCHRVVGSGDMNGYCVDMSIKEALIELEKRNSDQIFVPNNRK